MIDRSLDSSKFYSAWKEALFKPLVKKISAGTDKTNYRPVSNLGFIFKIVEKVTLEQFNNSPNTAIEIVYYQNISQHTGRTTVDKTSLINLVNDILGGMEDQLVTAICCTRSKCFI